MSFGSTEMYTALNVSAITSVIDTYNSSPAIFDDTLIPQDFGSLGNDGGDLAKSINYYLSDSESQTEVEIYNYIINCRAATMNESRNIAATVRSTISRNVGSGYFIYCEVQGTIPPADDTDNYNTPIQARIKLI